ncbi:MAG: hypothetical protein RIR70_1642 [Pseudomonadota bacterium]|jgi:DNA-binding NarL/FixJ family response regulator
MKILIVDDHPLIVEGVGAALAEIDREARILAAHTLQDALDTLYTHAPFDLVIADTGLKNGNGPELIKSLRAIQSDAPIAVLSALDNKQSVMAALAAGAMGFISKQSPTKVLIGAIKLILSGGVYIPPQVLDGSASPTFPQGLAIEPKKRLGLTDRQIEVLALLAEGKPNKLICRELNVSEGTVKTHVSAIFRTLNISNRAQVAYALNQLGLTLPQRGAPNVLTPSANAPWPPAAQHE